MNGSDVDHDWLQFYFATYETGWQPIGPVLDSEYRVFSADMAFKWPSGISAPEGALIEAVEDLG
jgi:hypothetical protein